MGELFGTLLDGLFATDFLSLNLREVLPRRRKHQEGGRRVFLGVSTQPPPAKALHYADQDYSSLNGIYDLERIGWLILGKVQVGGGFQVDPNFWLFCFYFILFKWNNQTSPLFFSKELVLGEIASPLQLITSITETQARVAAFENYLYSQMETQKLMKKGKHFYDAHNRLQRRMQQKRFEREQLEGAQEEAKNDENWEHGWAPTRMNDAEEQGFNVATKSAIPELLLVD